MKKINGIIFTVVIILIQTAMLRGQVTLTGTVTDAQSKEGLAFVNIGIRNKNVGTCSQINGTFSITIPAQYENDSLSFSMIGYAMQAISIKSLIRSGQNNITLVARPYALNEVVIAAKKLTEKKYGIIKYNPVLHFVDASLNHQDIFEIAQLLHLEKEPSKITSVNLYINESGSDSGTFRIKFYNYDGKAPSTLVAEENITQVHAIREGWLKFDLAKHNLYLKGDVIVAIEFLPGKKAINYEVKLGGKTKSFFRTSSLGEWQIPVHHYRLFVTALTDDGNSIDTDEEETVPSLKLFSAAVQDTFFVFIKLPEKYALYPNKKYPVIYLLDANVYFDAISDKQGKEAIVVGVGYKNAFEADNLRNRDYTYPKALETDSLFPSGGGDRFLMFFRNELLPLMDRTYRTDTENRTLMGHSLGGYFTLYALKSDLVSSAPLFANYIAASPSLDYCNGYLIKQFNTLSMTANTQRNLYLTIGEMEKGSQFNNILNILSADRFKALNVKSEVFSKTDHMGTALPTLNRTLKHFK